MAKGKGRKNKHDPQFHKRSAWWAGMTPEEYIRRIMDHAPRRRHRLFGRLQAPTPGMLAKARERRTKYMHAAARRREMEGQFDD